MLLVSLLLCAAAKAQTPAAAHHSLRLEARSLATTEVQQHASGMGKTPGRSGNTSYQKTNLEDSRTSLRTANIEVQVTNLTQEADQVKLEWYFVADPYGRHRLWIYDRGTRTLAIEPGRGEKFQVAAAPLENATTKNVSLYQTNNPNVRFRDSASVTKSGAKPAGWIVRMTAGDQLIDARASNSELETTARDPIKWGQLLEAKPPQLRP